MDLDYSPADGAFRADIRTWLEANLPRVLRDKVLHHKRLTRNDYTGWHKRPKEYSGPGWDGRSAISGTRNARVDETHWRAFAELGLLGLLVPKAQGGFDGGPVDMFVVVQKLGRALVVEPYWATVAGIESLRLGMEKASAFTGDLLARTARGEIRLAVAFNEPHARYDLFDLRTTAYAEGEHFTLEGTKSMVQHGAQADYWIARAHRWRRSAVHRQEGGGERADHQISHDRRAAHRDARLRQVARDAPRRARDWRRDARTDHRLRKLRFLLCAKRSAHSTRFNRATVEYTKERQQFGMPIAHFQALQHRMVDMLIHTEQARLITYLAAARYTGDDAATRARAISAAKARVGQAARFVGQQAVQLHGGMGVTNELPAAHWFKRLSIIETTLGDVDHHLARFASLPAFFDTED